MFKDKLLACTVRLIHQENGIIKDYSEEIPFDLNPFWRMEKPSTFSGIQILDKGKIIYQENFNTFNLPENGDAILNLRKIVINGVSLQDTLEEISILAQRIHSCNHDDEIAVNTIFEIFEDFIVLEEFRSIDKLFLKLKLDKLSLTTIKTLLSISAPLKTKLINREVFYNKAIKKLGAQAEKMIGNLV